MIVGVALDVGVIVGVTLDVGVTLVVGVKDGVIEGVTELVGDGEGGGGISDDVICPIQGPVPAETTTHIDPVHAQ